jgi:hypothetical protein
VRADVEANSYCDWDRLVFVDAKIHIDELQMSKKDQHNAYPIFDPGTQARKLRSVRGPVHSAAE